MLISWQGGERQRLEFTPQRKHGRTSERRGGDAFSVARNVDAVHYPEPRVHAGGGTLNRRLSMPRPAIFDSRVWRGIPSFAAAPRGPETRPWHSARAASIAFLSRSANSFLSSARTPERETRSSRELARFSLQPCLVDGERFSFAQDHGTLDYVLQFADVTWPIVGLEKIQRLLLYMADPLSRSLGISFDQILHQQRNVILPLAQGWYS